MQNKELEISHKVSKDLYFVHESEAYYLAKIIPNPTPLQARQANNEVNLLAELNPHPNIISLKGKEQTQERIVILYEYCYRSLARSLPRDPFKALYQLALGLKHMHSQQVPVLHRNLNPENIFYSQDSMQISGLEHSAKQYSSFQEVGSLANEKWRPPELISPQAHSVPSTKMDIWNLGMVFYYSLFGVFPFESTKCQCEGKWKPQEGVSVKVKELLNIMLRPNPFLRTEINGVLSKLYEEKSKFVLDSLFCIPRTLVFLRFKSRRSTAKLIHKYVVNIKQSVQVKKLVEKSENKPYKIKKFFQEMAKLIGLSHPRTRLNACSLLFVYLREAPLLAYEAAEEFETLVEYIDSQCFVKPKHPLKTQHFKAITNSFCSVIKEKFFIVKNHIGVVNGKLTLNDFKFFKYTSDSAESLTEELLSYWDKLLKTHCLLVSEGYLEQTRKNLRVSLVSEQVNLINLLNSLMHTSKPEYVRCYYQAKSLFEIDNSEVPQEPPELFCTLLIDQSNSAKEPSESSDFSLVDLKTETLTRFSRHINKSLRNWETSLDQLCFTKRIGRGSSCEVWLGTLKKTQVAIKQLYNSGSQNYKEFGREVSVLIKLRHPNLVLFLGAYLGTPLTIVTEFCEGGDLFHLLHKQDSVTLSWPQKLKILQEVAKGMHFLHSKEYLHRDLKSLNILLCCPILNPTDPIALKIADFGLSRVLKNPEFMTNQVGTCHWMAPEVLSGSEYTFKADVFSFAIVMYEVITREIPYSGLSHSEIKHRVLHNHQRPNTDLVPCECPKRLLKVMGMCWRTAPDKRPSFSSIVDLLEKVVIS